MAYFQWADDMVIDNGPIDQDHRKLVEQVNALVVSRRVVGAHNIIIPCRTTIFITTSNLGG